jgi:hypothetical protein
VIDDGRGMKRRDLARYHDVAASTKSRGEGIGFAGVGIKLGLLVSREVVTETRRGSVHVATRGTWPRSTARPGSGSRHPGLTSDRGTAVQLTLSNPLSPLLDGGYIEEAIRRHFEPLLDPAFDAILRRHYPHGIVFEVDGRRVDAGRAAPAERVTTAIRLGRRRRRRHGLPRAAPPAARRRPQGMAVSTFGKVIKRGWDWLGLTPAAPARISGLVEAPDLAACLTLSKNDFIRTGPRGATYLAYRKAIQEVVSRQLAQWGDMRDAEARPRVVRLERDLERVLEDLADDFPLLRSLVDRRPGGQKRLPLPGRGDDRVPGTLFANLPAGHAPGQDGGTPRSTRSRPPPSPDGEPEPASPGEERPPG